MTNKPKKEILIAEDSPTQSAQLSFLLEGKNYHVLKAVNGTEAMQLLSRVRPSLVISDIVMPEMDGYELCRLIKSDINTGQIPVILLTKLSDPEEIIKGLSCGADSFITKPYDNNYLLSIVEKILSSSGGESFQKVPFEVPITFKGKKRIIQAEQNNVIRLLIDIYEGAISQNEKLVQAQEELRSLNETLESIVDNRTSDLKEEIRLSNEISERLRVSEQKYHLIFDNVTDPYYETSVDGKIIELSPSVNHLTRGLYTRKELIGKLFHDYFYDPSSEEPLHVKIAKLGAVSDYEIILKNRDKSLIPCSVSAKIVTRHDGSPEKIIGSIHDISKRKEAEKKINEERILLRTLIDNLPDPIYVTDKEGRKVIANKADVDNIGLSSEADVLGHTDLEVFPPEIGERGHKDNLSVIKTGKPIINREEYFVNADGTKRWLLTTKLPLRDADNSISGLIGIGIDITSRKLLLEDLQKSQVQLLNAHRIAHLGSWEYDIKNDVFILNDPFFDIFHTSSEIAGGYTLNFEKYLKLFVHPDDAERVKAEITKAPDYDDPDFNMQLEHKFFYAEGETGYMSIQYFIDRDDQNNIMLAYGVNQDITRQKMAELELIRAKETAEASDRLKTAFLHNISHEIRTPMNAIVGFSSLLADSERSEDQKKLFIDTIVSSSNHLLSIINDIVEISNIEAGQIKLSKTNVDLDELLHSVFEMNELKAEEVKIDLKCQISKNTSPVQIYTDKTKLKQILNNLVGNAIKFTHSGGVTFGYSIINGYAEFYVKDTGIGISKENLQRIFDRFYQVENTESRNYEGTGLGLSISKAYVEILGGNINVQSELNKGSEFRFTIPLNFIKRKDAKISESESMKTSTGKEIKILVAEDVESNFKLIKYFLSSLNAIILRAENGLEAVRLFADNNDIDLILMDIKMPVMDGYEAVAKIRSTGSKVPIIAQTAYVEDHQKALEYGCNGFITKPFDRKKLLMTIEQLVKMDDIQTVIS